MPVKRSPSSSPTGEKVAKFPKVADTCPAATLVGHFQVPLQCEAMIRAGLPFAFPAERHPIQQTFVDSLYQIAHEEEARRADAVRQAHDEVAAHNTKSASAVERLSSARQRQDELRAQVEGAKATLESCRGTLSCAEEERQQVKHELERQECAQVSSQRAFDEFPGRIAEIWTPLKSALPAKWQARRKAIDVLASFMNECGASESLIAAIRTSMKEQPETRTGFGLVAIEHAEKIIQAHLAGLEEGSKECHGAVALALSALEKAEAACRDHGDGVEQASEKFTALSVEHQEACRLVDEIEQDIQQSEAIFQQLSCSVVLAEEDAKTFDDSFVCFKRFVSGVPDAPVDGMDTVPNV